MDRNARGYGRGEYFRGYEDKHSAQQRCSGGSFLTGEREGGQGEEGERGQPGRLFSGRAGTVGRRGMQQHRS